MRFFDRKAAGKELAGALKNYQGQDVVVLALPRGGVPVAAEVARALKAPLDLILVRKIGLPFDPELAMGALVDGDVPIIVRNEDVIRAAGIDDETFTLAAQNQLREIERRRQRYLAGRARPSIEGRIAIVIDDGVATGATMRAALRATCQKNPKKLVLATPVIASDALASLKAEADDAVALEVRDNFGGIGAFYDDFHQLSDEEVVGLLREY